MTTFDEFGTDAGVREFTQTIPMTLQAGGSMGFSYAINGGNPIIATRLVTTGLANFVGTGSLSPVFSLGESVTAKQRVDHRVFR